MSKNKKTLVAAGIVLITAVIAALTGAIDMPGQAEIGQAVTDILSTFGGDEVPAE